MFDFLLVLVGILAAVTVGAAVEYYRRLSKAQKEYEKAKELVEDVVISFNRQLGHEAEKLEAVAYKVEANAAKAEGALRRVGEAEKKLTPLENRVSVVGEQSEKVLVRCDEIDKKMLGVTTSQEALKAKISVLEDQARQFSITPEAKIEAVIPIRRDKAMASLTITELSVLEMLASEGPKTAPEIKERVKLSREHTARLMKKLYEHGYLERDANQIPFKYSIKKEMENLLKKPESEQV
ncbi:MAG TPA: MarR family transcriptional regulator [Candidatus Bathyarchaeia archaeon]